MAALQIRTYAIVYMRVKYFQYFYTKLSLLWLFITKCRKNWFYQNYLTVWNTSQFGYKDIGCPNKQK